MNLSIPEGMQVHASSSTAYVGGCADTKLVVVDLTPLPAPPSLRGAVRDGNLFNQMVSTPNPRPHDVFFALYGGYGASPVGGIARFVVDANGGLAAAERLLDARLVGANRVSLIGRSGGFEASGFQDGARGVANTSAARTESLMALLPLEHSPVGGLAVVRLAPAPLVLDSLVHFDNRSSGASADAGTTRCFCAVAAQGAEGTLVHAFVGASSSMFSYELK